MRNMEQKTKALVRFAIENHVSDIHFHCVRDEVHIFMRNENGIQLYDECGDIRYVTYLRYISNLDLSSSMKLQSGQCSLEIDGEIIPLRFSYLKTPTLCNSVLRILKSPQKINIDNLSFKKEQNRLFRSLCEYPDGLLVFSGATGSGKTTTMYALLDHLSQMGKNIITLEDPIEMYRDTMIQIQVHEPTLTYQDGLKQALRHDPDVLMVGEIRDSESARMAIRCALTGHLVLTTIHAKSAQGAIMRLRELGISKDEIASVLRLVSYQRIVKGKKKPKICLYELIYGDKIERILQGEEVSNGINREIQEAFDKGYITKSEAISNGFDL